MCSVRGRKEKPYGGHGDLDTSTRPTFSSPTSQTTRTVRNTTVHRPVSRVTPVLHEVDPVFV